MASKAFEKNYKYTWENLFVYEDGKINLHLELTVDNHNRSTPTTWLTRIRVYANFTNTTFQKIILPHLTRTLRQQVLH